MSADSPAIDCPSTSVTMSPSVMPDRSAGEPSNTLRTSSPRGDSSTLIPTPSNSPLIDCSNWAVSSGLK